MPYAAARMATWNEDAGRYQRHRPEQTLIYQIVDEYYPVFTAYLVEHDCRDAGGRATYGAVAEGSYLASDAVDDEAMTPLLRHSITYRIAVGPQAGRKVFTLQTLNVHYQLKTPYKDGTTHVIFEPLDFMYRKYGMPRAQEAQERPAPASPHWCQSQESTSLDYADIRIDAMKVIACIEAPAVIRKIPSLGP